MHPIIGRLGPVTIYSYGLLVALGFILGTLLASGRAHKFDIPADKIGNLSLIMLISGIIGARLFYIFLNLKDYILNPAEIFMITHGGLVFYGGAIFAFVAAVIYVKLSRLSVLNTGDLLAPYIALGHSIGRIGCLLNGCCFGRPTSGPGIIFGDGVIRIPTQIYSSLLLLCLFLILRYLSDSREFKGQVFFLYLILYSAGRVFIETLRGDNSPVILQLTFSQLISMAIFAAGIAGYFICRRKKSF
ncbi:MAG: prolipoprotein diacylglyceryl transferase [Candidatus Omnitrophica bacterium]|nr:prolipoprotein diacylglyceryl transferase [Candidatus Omnitrophota bacterium]